MKKIFAAFLAVLLVLLVFAGCAGKTSPGEGTLPSGETTLPDAVPTGDADPTKEDSAAPSTEETSAEETTAVTDPRFEPVNKYLSAPRDEAAWLDAAKTQFDAACRVFFTYMCSSAWLQVDKSAPAIYDVYYPVLNFSSMAEAEADFLTVFSENGFGTALESVLLERDGKLYAAIADRGADDAYQGFDIESIDKVEDGYIEFTVRPHYTDGDDLSKFALRWERNAYRVDKFEMPY